MRPVIIFSLIAHHTLIICFGSSWIEMGYSADQYALFSEITFSFTKKKLG